MSYIDTETADEKGEHEQQRTAPKVRSAEDIIAQHPDPSMLDENVNPISPFEVYSIDGTTRNFWVDCKGPIDATPYWTVQVITDETNWKDPEALPQTYNVPVDRLLAALPDYYYPSLIKFVRSALDVIDEYIRENASQLMEAPAKVEDEWERVRIATRSRRVISATMDALGQISDVWLKSHEDVLFGNDQDPAIRMRANELIDRIGHEIPTDAIILVTQVRSLEPIAGEPDRVANREKDLRAGIAELEPGDEFEDDETGHYVRLGTSMGEEGYTVIDDGDNYSYDSLDDVIGHLMEGR